MIKTIDKSVSVPEDEILKTEFGCPIPLGYSQKTLKECLYPLEVLSIEVRCSDIDNWYIISAKDENQYDDKAARKRVVIHGQSGKIDHRYLVYEHMNHSDFYWALRADMDKLLTMSKRNSEDTKENERTTMEEAANTKKHDVTPPFTKEILESELDKFCDLIEIDKTNVVLIKESALVMHGKIDRCKSLKIALTNDDCKKLDPRRFKLYSTWNETVFKDIYGFTEVYCSFVPGDKPGTVKLNDGLPESEEIDGYKVSPVKDAVNGICDDIYELKLKKRQLELSISFKEKLIGKALGIKHNPSILEICHEEDHNDR